MTTMAWDGEMLAVDSQATSGCGTKTMTDKLRVGKWSGMDAAYAGTGSRAEADEIADWLFGTGDKPTLDDDGTHGLLVTYQKAYFIEGKRCRIIPVIDRFHALGSGRESALGALHEGANAERAVTIACQVDAYSGGPIQTYVPTDGAPRVDYENRKLVKFACIGEGCDATLYSPAMCTPCARKLQAQDENHMKFNAVVADERARVRRVVGEYMDEKPGAEAFAFEDVVDYLQKAMNLLSYQVKAPQNTLVSILETVGRGEPQPPMCDEEKMGTPITLEDLDQMDSEAP